MMLRQLLLPATTALSLLSQLNGAAALVLEQRPISANVEELPRPATLSDFVLPMRFGLTQPNLDKADAYVSHVSDPTSPNFAQYWTAQQVSDTFKPSVASYSAVRAWILAAGIPPENVATAPDGRGWLRSNMTVAQAESLLHTTYNLYESKSNGNTYIACQQYSIPDDLEDDIDVITPGTTLTRVKLGSTSSSSNAVSRRSQSSQLERRYGTYPPFHPWPPAADNLTTCYTAITPNCIRALYNIPELSSSHPDNSMGIFSLWQNPGSQEDYDLLFKHYAPQLVGKGPTIVGIDHNNSATPPSYGTEIETDMDVELVMPLVYPLIPQLYAPGNGVLYGNGSDTVTIVEDLDDVLDAFDASYCKYEGGGEYNGSTQCGGVKAPNVVSVSYSEAECINSPYYMIRQCHEFMKSALQGTTWIFASGDQGVTDHYPLCSYQMDTEFYPSFPCSCPWVTTVGGTLMKTNATVHDRQEASGEEAATSSGGGFSNIFDRPTYQNNTIESWLKNHPTGYGPKYFNHTTRGYPDLSATAGFVIAAYNGSLQWSGGTSAAVSINPMLLFAVSQINISV
jgi:tripeptidyl-peptidase-1